MVQFLISVIDRQTGLASAAEMQAIGAFNARLAADGHWVFAGGLSSPDQAIVIDGRPDEPLLTEGSLHTGPEYISGFWVIDARSLEEARALATDASRHCNRRVELRPLLDG
jgi:hypothetical protein